MALNLNKNRENSANTNIDESNIKKSMHRQISGESLLLLDENHSFTDGQMSLETQKQVEGTSDFLEKDHKFVETFKDRKVMACPDMVQPPALSSQTDGNKIFPESKDLNTQVKQSTVSYNSVTVMNIGKKSHYVVSHTDVSETGTSLITDSIGSGNISERYDDKKEISDNHSIEAETRIIVQDIGCQKKENAVESQKNKKVNEEPLDYQKCDELNSVTLPKLFLISENETQTVDSNEEILGCKNYEELKSGMLSTLVFETQRKKEIIGSNESMKLDEETLKNPEGGKLNSESSPKFASKIKSLHTSVNIGVHEKNVERSMLSCDEEVVSETKNSDSVLAILEKSLLAMSPENKSSVWFSAITDLSKAARSAFKKNQKEVVTVLVKNMIVDKFISFVDINNITFVGKPISQEMDSLKYWPSFKRFLTLFWILCDSSLNFCQYILTSKLFEYMMLELKMLSTNTQNLSDKTLYLLKAILGILHNVARHIPSSKWVFRNEGLVAVLRLFLNCDIAMVRVKALIILSYITSETENDLINSDDENFQFIIQVLTDAVNSDNHISLKYGMSAAEVLKGLCNLSVNDENKIRIVKNGCLPLYEQFLDIGTKEEKKLAITSLWSLAFHHYNKQKMRDNKGIMEKLHALEFPEGCSDEDEICHAARGTIWELENTSAATIDRNYSSSTEKDSQQPHIMISYQWDSQSIMVKVKDKLRQAGYKVWMDVEHMTGSTLEAMALAVEKAAVVLICMSQKYKNSPNCRTEAEYVYRLRKDFVPLRLQRDYVPDGWLGIMVGTRLYFDVYTEETIDMQIPRLVKELRDRGKIFPCDIVDQGLVTPARMLSREAVPLLASRSMEVVAWSQVEVNNWLKSAGCEDILNRLPPLDGPMLSELQHIQGQAPEFFYSLLKSEMEFTVIELLKFSRCLRNLTR